MAEEITKQTEGTPSAAQVGEVLPPEPDARALNAVSHGLTAEHIPPDEREGYAQHAQAVRASTGAQTYLEQRLADRAALALWRLDRVARYEAAQSSAARRAVRGQIKRGTPSGLAGGVTAAYEALHTLLPWYTPEQLRAAPEVVEHEAQQIEGESLYLLSIVQGGSTGGCSEDEAAVLGEALYSLLTHAQVPARDMVRAMMGRPPKRGEAESVTEGEWVYEPGEVPGLLALYRDRLGDRAGPALTGHAARHAQKAAQIRAALGEAQAAESDALALAALPAGDVLDKVTRYEAHLERVLYRALHDLEAARRERQGKDSPPPLRGVLDERPSE